MLTTPNAAIRVTVLSFLPMVSIIIATCVAKQREAFYQRQDNTPICNIDQRKQLGCTKAISRVRGKLECISKCERDDFCIGVSLDAATGTTCFLHEACPSEVSCTAEVDRHTDAWFSYCVHGRWDTKTESCVCSHGCSGKRCDKYLKTCRDVVLSVGYAPGRNWVMLDHDDDGYPLENVLCYISAGDTASYSVNVFGNDGKDSSAFNRTWSDFVNGFYEDESRFWVGLRNWHALSSYVGCQEIVLVFYYGAGYLSTRTRYTGFVVNDESGDYSFSLSTNPDRHGKDQLHGDYFGNCLGPLQNVPFSTWDQNNDASSQENCAAWRGSGWWYSSCDSTCNLLGSVLVDWEGTPPQQRVSVLGVDMDRASDVYSQIHAYITCPG